VGNVLLNDEGVGVHIAQKLMTVDLPPEVQVIEGGTDGFGLMHLILEADQLILIDAVKGGGAPGSIYRFDLKDCPPYPDPYKTSVHQISILEVIHLADLIGNIPTTTIIGIEPKSTDMGMALSPEVEAKIPKVMKLVREELTRVLGRQVEL
jgi:hydrogenase maturation protease